MHGLPCNLTLIISGLRGSTPLARKSIEPAMPQTRNAMNTTQACSDVCNRLLRGELAAIETYTRAIGGFRPGTERETLQKIRADHANSAAVLCDHLVDMGTVPVAIASSTWAIPDTVPAGDVALAALMAGEERERQDYAAALRDPALTGDIQSAIRTHLLPPLVEHLAKLGRLRPG